MSIEKSVFIFAGSMVLLMALLTHFVHPNFFWGSVYVGVNMLQSTVTGFCLPGIIMKKMGMKTAEELILEKAQA